MVESFEAFRIKNIDVQAEGSVPVRSVRYRILEEAVAIP